MRVAVLHNAVEADAPPEDQDTLVQVEMVAGALARLGHQPTTLSCTLDLAALRDGLRRQRPDAVFNLVESLAGSDSLAYLPLGVLDMLGLPYAGSSTQSLLLTTHKLLAKGLLRQAGLPTPDWIESSDSNRGGDGGVFTWILKGVCDQGSRDMEDDAVLRNLNSAEARGRLAERTVRSARPCFAERFVEGREFVVPLLAGRNGPAVLPISEIVFADYPPDKPRIVGYRAKWRDDCFEYHHTPRRFDFEASDAQLLERLSRLAEHCWRLLRLRGWARVDFRVDAAGAPWILEVNANPCLSPEAGFAAALERASIPFDDAIRRILENV
jgi:D-alanine-D-alanine ligase